MYSKEKINSAVKHLLEQCVNQMHTLYQEEEITDFYIHVDPGSGEMRIVDDNDTLLSREAIPSDLQSDEENDAPEGLLADFRQSLKEELQRLNTAKAFDDVNVFHPFSFLLETADDIEDLMIVDDANYIIGDELLKGLDDDLDSFIDNLMKN